VSALATYRVVCPDCTWAGFGAPATLAKVRLGAKPYVVVAVGRIVNAQVARDEQRARSVGGTFLRQRVETRDVLQPRRVRRTEVATAHVIANQGKGVVSVPISINAPTTRTDFQPLDAVDTGRRLVICSRGHRHQVTRRQLIRVAAWAAREGVRTASI